MNNFWKADLHCHTHFSDGTCSVEEVIKRAKSLGIKGLSITDHDSIEAYHLAPAIAEQNDLLLLGGVEFSTTFANQSIHVLGYSFRLDSPEIHNLCERHISRRRDRNRAILLKLKSKGFSITEEDLLDIARQYPKATIGRPHIAQAMVRKGYVPTIKEAFQLYIGDAAPCFVQGEPITTQETLQAIKSAGGISVLAHPHLIEDGKTIEKLLNLDFDGIEAYYASFSPEQNERWIKIAQKKKLMIVGGSDFHGDIKTNSLGSSWTPKETFDHLWNTYIKNNPRLFVSQ